ncbi:sulfatase-like hydrolase/transferase [Cellulophaga sp. 20_2_10]|uniref:alkaline phosphatase family protein n=1 Tax=Cellulophaga sp. 20_2_10 TaxID=2942476 RepID=UPI00201ABA85|nr:alkaline phosphatase family protein [Cellulophaga sp. 20_2_10]MCL5244356.1 sulfatase-like hydrolase/transferase [Cellulophaga sp. 20_2_10]
MNATIANTSPDLTLKHYTRLLISFAFVLILLSLYQYIVLFNKGIIDSILSISFLLSITHHLGYTAFVGLLLAVPFHFLEKSKFYRGFRCTLFILIVLLSIECFLLVYYTKMYTPLGADILEYNFNSIKTAAFKNITIPFLLLLMIVIVVFIFYGTYLITAKYYHYVNKMFPFTFFLLSIFIANLFMAGQPINQNKTQYLAVNLYEDYLEDDSYLENRNNPPYPLLKKNATKDVLGSYFNLKKQKPNIVLIMVNGLGSNFIGTKATYRGFTPFLDSLAQQSLYWKNCLSTTAKDFGAVPAITGSLPYGKKGFMELSSPVNRLTLFGILKNNGYTTAYLQGTNSSFNNLDNFVQQEQVDLLLNRSYYGANYSLSPTDDSGHSIGYPDKELFKKSFNTNRNSYKPRLDVFFTTSTAEPFLVPNQSLYINKVEKIVEQSRLVKSTIERIEDHKNRYASLLYADNAIQYFIQAYKAKKEYSNTIFVITGTHNLAPVTTNNQLRKFHVPLLIYSPLLKKPETIKGVTSHLDIAPSLVSLLANNYGISVPKKIAWLGEELSTTKHFTATRDIPLMRTKSQIKDYIHNNYFYTSGSVYKFDERLNLTQTTNDTVKDLLVNFKSINSYVTRYNKLIPENLAIFKVKKEVFSEADKIWLNSILNGQSFGSAYKTAQNLAFKGETDKALRICKYILIEIPSHIDAKILTGRINAWNKDYVEAEKILRKCISLNPSYADSYKALLDVYFWSNQNEKSMELEFLIKRNNIDDKQVAIKLKRAYTELAKKTL